MNRSLDKSLHFFFICLNLQPEFPVVFSYIIVFLVLDNDKEIPPEFKNFKATIQKELKITPIKIERQALKFQELKSKNTNSSVRAYVIENFLSDFECDSLMRVHKKYLEIYSKNDPILCFDSIQTLKKNLKELKLKYKVSSKDFTVGTTCLNESFSSRLKPHFKWSHSTAFYPGENKFSTAYAQRIQDATGLKQENGGKFQITSYPIGVGKDIEGQIYKGRG